MIKSFNQLKHIEQVDNLQAWLFKVANNSVIDFYRQQGRHPHEPLQQQDIAIEKDEEQNRRQLSQCLLAFIQALSEDTQALLTQIDLNGTSQKNYAEKHNMTYSTLKSQVQKSRNELRQLFNQCCQFELNAQGQLVDYQPKQSGCSGC